MKKSKQQVLVKLKIKLLKKNLKKFLIKINSLKIKRKWKSNYRRSSYFWLFATVDGNKFEGSEGKGVQLELEKIFLKGFDEQLIGVKNDTKILDATLPANHPKKELANKKTKFECKILNVKTKASKIDDDFAKLMGAKDVADLKSLQQTNLRSILKH